MKNLPGSKHLAQLKSYLFRILTKINLRFANNIFVVFAFDTVEELVFSCDSFVENKITLSARFNKDGESLTICFLFSEQIGSSSGVADTSIIDLLSTSSICSTPSSLVMRSLSF